MASVGVASFPGVDATEDGGDALCPVDGGDNGAGAGAVVAGGGCVGRAGWLGAAGRLPGCGNGCGV
jgi:hypothetical protein